MNERAITGAGDAWQSDYWNGPAGERASRYYAQLDHALDALNRAIVERARLRSGDCVLDVGCGCGSTSLAAAGVVGPRGSVTGIDISAPMLGTAVTRAQSQDHVHFIRADAAEYDFGRPFDAIVSRLGLMFFREPVAAMSHLRNALKPEGVLSFVSWRSLSENAWLTTPLRAVREALALPQEPPLAEAGPFSFADPRYVKGVLGEAGFRDVTIDPYDVELPLSKTSLEEAVDFIAVHAGPVGRLLASLPSEEARQRGRAAVKIALQPHDREGVVRLGSASWLVQARR